MAFFYARNKVYLGSVVFFTGLYFYFFGEKKGKTYGFKNGAHTHRITQAPLFEKKCPFLRPVFYFIYRCHSHRH
jgi:hypothetical protein